MTPRTLLLAIACLLVAVPGRAAEIVTVTLVGGGKVTGPLLRQNDDGVVLDLGFEVVQIPAKRVLAVTSEDTSGRKAEVETDRGIFRTGTLEGREVPELVKRFGEAVVMVRNPGGLGTGAPASRTLGLAIYIVLCGAALLWTQSGPAVGNSGVQFVLAEEG